MSRAEPLFAGGPLIAPPLTRPPLTAAPSQPSRHALPRLPLRPQAGEPPRGRPRRPGPPAPGALRRALQGRLPGRPDAGAARPGARVALPRPQLPAAAARLPALRPRAPPEAQQALRAGRPPRRGGLPRRGAPGPPARLQQEAVPAGAGHDGPSGRRRGPRPREHEPVVQDGDAGQSLHRPLQAPEQVRRAHFQAEEGPLQQRGGPAAPAARFRGGPRGSLRQQHVLRGPEGRPAEQRPQRPAPQVPGLPGGGALHRQHRGPAGVPGPRQRAAGGPALQQPGALGPPGGPPAHGQVHQPRQPEAALQQHRRAAALGGHGGEPPLLCRSAREAVASQGAEFGFLQAFGETEATSRRSAGSPGEPRACLLLPSPQRPQLPVPEPPHAGAEEAGPERQQPLRLPASALPAPSGRGLVLAAPPGHHGVPPDGRAPGRAAAGAVPLRPPPLPGRLRQPAFHAGAQDLAAEDGGPGGPAPGRLPLPRGLLRRAAALAALLLQPLERLRGRGAVLPGERRAAAHAAELQPRRRRLDDEPLQAQHPRLLQLVAPRGLAAERETHPGQRGRVFPMSCLLLFVARGNNTFVHVF